MTWCNINNPSTSSNIDISTNNDNNNNNNNNNNIPTSDKSTSKNDGITSKINNPIHTISCPSCGHHFPLQDQAAGGINELPGLPAGVKFDPSDTEILEHLEAKVRSDLSRLHPLLHEFIPTIEGENGICYTHPDKLPGMSKDGVMRHFFHCPSKAYTTGTRKRRKVYTNNNEDASGSGETRWHKTGKTRPILFNGGVIKGFKKILVLYTNYGRQKKPEKTNWVMHQYHLGLNEDEKDGEFVLSKVFYQTQPRQCGAATSNNIKHHHDNIIHHHHHLPHQPTLLVNPSPPGLFTYYNNNNTSYNLLCDHHHHQNHHHHHHHNNNNVVLEQSRESPSQLIPNLIVQGDGSSLFSVSTARKA